MTCLSCSISLPCEGEVANGDAIVVREEGAAGLLAIIDALGHGPDAAKVAAMAVHSLQAVAVTCNVLGIIQRLHEALRGTRGAAALVCVYAPDRIDACSIGNVEMRCARGRFSTVFTPGILGGHMRRPRVFGGPIQRPERVVIYSDGISARFGLDGLRGLTPAQACHAIIDHHRRPHDDASVLVADLEQLSIG